MIRLLILCVMAFGLQAQVYVPIGTATDGCVGGSIWAVPALRYGNFVCTIQVGQPGLYNVTLAFVEPNVTVVGGRSFSAFANGFLAVQKLDLVAAGASSASVTITRTFPAVSIDGTIKIQMVSVIRNAVLSSVTAKPAPLCACASPPAGLCGLVRVSKPRGYLPDSTGSYWIAAGVWIDDDPLVKSRGFPGPGGKFQEVQACALIGRPADTGTYDAVVFWEADSAFHILLKDGRVSRGAVSSEEFLVGMRLDCASSVADDNTPDGQIGEPYSFAIAAAGFAEPYTFAIKAGAPPTGLTLDTATGVISGTPTAAAEFSYTVQATDALGLMASADCSTTILAAN